MTSVLKIAYVVDNKILSLYVFIGSRLIDRDISDLNEFYRNNPTDDIFKDLLTSKETTDIKNGIIDVNFINESIYLDDSIEVLKKKFLLAAKNLDIPYEGLYMFAQQTEQLDPTSVYQNITQNGKLDLTQERLMQFLLNIDEIDSNKLENKEIYDYDDILALGLNQRKFLVSKPVGQKFVAMEKTYPYTVNPYKVIKYDPFLEKFVSELTTTTNSSLILNTGKINDQVIFACSANDVLVNAQKKELSEESTIKIYFPYLLDSKITNLDIYTEKKEELLKITDNMITDKEWRRNMHNVNLYYNIYKTRKTNLPFFLDGIKSVHLTIHPTYTFNLPLDIVFKLIHASRKVPLIKLNPGKRQEKAYRLYADRIATNGQRIPYLQRSTIFRLMKTIGKSKKVSVYCEHTTQEEEIISIIIDFENNGDVSLTTYLPKLLSMGELDKLLQEVSRPIINSVQDYLAQSGYTIHGFNSLKDPHVEIHDMKFTMALPITKKLNLKKYTACLSSIFSITSDDITEGAILRLKRVDNYNEMDSQEALIVELLNQGIRDVEIIDRLMSNFGKTQEEARQKLVSFVNNLQVVQDAFKTHKLKIRNNPGFLTTMTHEKFSTNLVIEVSGINNIGYLDTIPIYLDSLIRLTQEPDTSAISITKINNACKKKKILETEQHVSDKIALAEQLHPERAQMDFQANELVFETQDDEDKDAQDAMIDILMGFDDEGEDEDEDEDETYEDKEEIQFGGNNNENEIKRDITGMRLSNPNPFFSRLYKREPLLFLKENEGGFKSYSRLCPSSAKRQPIILTKEEKDKIDKKHPGSYEHVIEYQTSKDSEKYYYICPRYWSLKDNVSLTEEEAKSGKYGEIIDSSDRKVKPGKTIYEFNTKYQQGSDGEYTGSHPGFLKPSKHPEGLCIPCCFSQWEGDQKARREACQQEPGAPSTVKDKKKVTITEVYVKGIDKFPLEQGRYGYLPTAVQRFLYTDNKKCQISATNTNLRKNYPCLLRFGVETSRNQSFVAAIAAIYEDVSGKILSIKKMKEQFIAAMDIDKFMTLQNGNLIDIFDTNVDVDIDKYKESKIYKNTDYYKPAELNLLRKTIRSYKNFKAFIRDDEITINYQYLWDLISYPNDNLFKEGINLVIIELQNDDITDNINIICPTNHYTNTFYDDNRYTCIILKIGNYYEPLFTMEDKGDLFSVSRRFSVKYKNILPSLKQAFNIIKKSLNERCMPLPSQPKIYTFKHNIPLSKLSYLLKLKNFKIEKQVLNYNGKVVGVIVEHTEYGKGFIPCYPSSPLLDLTEDYIWINEFYGESYSQTRDFLLNVYKFMNERIPCKPVLKIKEDGLIVGIITETNQFIPINEPTLDVDTDDIKSIDDVNYAVIDKESITSQEIDKDRVNYIHKIKLETSFFNVFRNIIRILLSKFEHHKLRSEIEDILKDSQKLYTHKLQQINEKLRELTQPSIIFADYTDTIIDNIVEVTSCTLDDKCLQKDYCLIEDNKCKLIIPQVNLITGKNNEAAYFGRMADELIRYNRIKSFIFQPKMFLTFSKLKYNLKDDEIIMLQSLLTKSYFDELIPAPINIYTKYNTYDTAEPLITQTYTNIIKSIEQVTEVECDKPSIRKLNKWKKPFPLNSQVLVFPNSPPQCSFDLILTLVRYHNSSNANISKNELKEVLLDEYIKYYSEYSEKLIDTLIAEGKINLSELILSNRLSIDNMIMNAEYYITNLDLWLLANRFNIPIVILFNTGNKNKNSLFVLHNDKNKKYYFITQDDIQENVSSRYSLVVTNKGAAKFTLSELSLLLQQEIHEKSQQTDIVDFMNTVETNNANKSKTNTKREKIMLRVK
jgi:hypothetical protein